uniref:Axonemal dynein light chain domain containing 1 n=1 Tax=Poecilia latipinna TaxID=48699 RepID=A0A3B3U8Z4_9TELE
KQAAIPDELLLSLTSTVSKNTQGHTAHHRTMTHFFLQNDGIRRPDGVWHYPLGRTKYKYFLEQPTSLTEAGRSVRGMKLQANHIMPPFCVSKNLDVKQNVIPEEYRIVKNKGIRCLQLYEDAFTVQLKDEEQKLRVLPSLRPSGRLEVIQLMRMMDDMLEKAGVDQEDEELTDLCQLESLLELVKTEQNIYNIVFHELIRQVTVGCAERGQLLAKLRSRYQSLLERIPRRLTSLHAEVVAQRALDRRLIEEIYHIKTTIQEINMYVAKVRDHDAFVSDKVQHAQEELAKSYKDTLSCSDVVQGYHRMYELHRTRLEDQLLKMTGDRDYWSQFTFNLALKVQEAILLCCSLFLRTLFFISSLCVLKIIPSAAIHQLLASLFKLLDFWASETHVVLQLLCPLSAMSPSDWAKLEEALSNCQNMSAEIFLYFSFTQKEKQTDPKMVTCLHKGQTNWMLDLLLHMLPDQTEEEDKYLKREDKLENSRQALVKDAKRLSKKLVYYSRFITRYQKLSLSVVALSIVSKKIHGFIQLKMLFFYSRSCSLILEQSLVVDPYIAEVGDRRKHGFFLSCAAKNWKCLMFFLSDSEKLTIIAENRARAAEEALTEALIKIKDLERLLQRQPAPEPPSKDGKALLLPGQNRHEH